MQHISQSEQFIPLRLDFYFKFVYFSIFEIFLQKGEFIVFFDYFKFVLLELFSKINEQSCLSKVLVIIRKSILLRCFCHLYFSEVLRRSLQSFSHIYSLLSNFEINSRNLLFLLPKSGFLFAAYLFPDSSY